MTESIKAAAAQLAEAKLRAEQAGTVLSTAGSALENVRERIVVLEAERSGIVAARKGGKTNGKQGARLAELGADLEGLAEILSEAVQAHSAASTDFARVTQSVSAAEFALSSASDQSLLVHLREAADDLARRLAHAITEIAAVTKRLGGSRAVWFPTTALATQIRRLDLEQGGI
jgi:hypothetical protein